MTETPEPATGSPSDAAGEAPRLALRSPVEVLLWIFLTRLVALVMPTRSGGTAATTDTTDTSASTGPGAPADPNRAGRVAASRPGPGEPAADPAGRTRGAADEAAGRRDASSTRAIAVTTATALAAGAAAFAAGRRRGAR